MQYPTSPDLTRYRQALQAAQTLRMAGRVSQVVGLTIEAQGLDCQIGEICDIQANGSSGLAAMAGVGTRKRGGRLRL